jgi:hypothetical protein
MNNKWNLTLKTHCQTRTMSLVVACCHPADSRNPPLIAMGCFFSKGFASGSESLWISLPSHGFLYQRENNRPEAKYHDHLG